MDEIIVGIIVAGAIVFTLKSFVDSHGKKGTCGCSGCGGCSSKNECFPQEKH